MPATSPRPVEPGLRRLARDARRHDRRARGPDQQSGPRRTLRQHRRRPDREAGRRPHHRLQRLLQVGRELPRQGPVRRPDLPDRLQLLECPGAGFELFANYDKGPWSLYGNLAWSQVNSININSAQFNFAQAELDFIANNWIFADHNQSWTGSAGAAYVFNMDTDWATRVSADMLYGNGLRQTIVTPNDTALPAYATLNLSVTSGCRSTAARAPTCVSTPSTSPTASISFAPEPESAWVRPSSACDGHSA